MSQHVKAIEILPRTTCVLSEPSELFCNSKFVGDKAIWHQHSAKSEGIVKVRYSESVLTGQRREQIEHPSFLTQRGNQCVVEH